MSDYVLTDIRNVALVGHADAGKTTLADTLLHKYGAVERAGSVKDKTSVFDYDDLEKERGHSIDAAVAHCTAAGRQLTIIDTPGYPDFIGEAVGAYNACDLALVCVNASAGVQTNTKRTWYLGRGEGRARAIVVTKCDLMKGKLLDVLNNIRATLGDRCIPWHPPEEVGNFDDIWTEAVVEGDDALLERYLEDGNADNITPEQLKAVAAPALAKGKVVPVIFTSSETGEGLDTLASFISEVAPSPRSAIHNLVDENDENAEFVEPDPDGDFVGVVWKVVIDKHIGKLGYVRVLRGTLKAGDTLINVRLGKKEKIGHPFRLQGKEHEEHEPMMPGELAVVSKVDSLQVGDTLVHTDAGKRVHLNHGPSPMYSLAVFPETRGDEAKIAEALHKLDEESLTFSSHREMSTHEQVISGMSQLHLEIVLKRLRERSNIKVKTQTPRVPYRESVSASADAMYRHKKQSGGRGQFAQVNLSVEPAEEGAGLIYEWAIFGGSIPRNFEPAIEKGVRERMASGILAGYPLNDIKVKVTDGKFHDVDSSEAAFKIAGGRAFSEAVRLAKPRILEPFAHVEITTPNQYMGDVSGDLNTRRGRIQGMEQDGEDQVIEAEMPLSEAAEYTRVLTALTSGEGSFTMKPSHYEPVPSNIQQSLIAEFKPQEED